MSKNWRQLISQPKYGIIEERDVFVPVRDGTKLALNIFRPDAPGKFPALLAMSPYGKDEQDIPLAPQPLFKSAVWDGNIEAGEKTEIVPRGYVHVVVDVRGTGNSEGEYFGGYSSLEGRDGHDLVEWLATQPWCDGNVGMVGYSYFSKIQLKVAIEQPPHLKAIFVSHVGVDHYRDGNYPGGVLSLFAYGLWDGRHGTSGIARKNAVPESERRMSPEEFERQRQELLKNPDITHYPNLYHLLNYPYKNPRFFDMLMYPFDHDFWKDRSSYPFFDKIKVPVHVIGKVAHEAGAFWDLYEGIDTVKKIMVKPSAPEERPWREDVELVIRWYDHWLKGNDTGLMDEPPVKIYITGVNQWRYEKEWPVPGTEWAKCYLRRWEGLAFNPELYQDEPDAFLQQPLHLSDKRDGVKYVTPVVHENFELLGPASFNFYASIDQDDTNWIVKLYDVAPDGAQTRLGKGYLKATHRALDPAKSKPCKPYYKHVKADPVTPGQIYEYNIYLGILTHVVTPGHRLKLTVESMESPRDPEMQIHYHPHLCSSKTTLHKIYHSQEYPSHLLLPIVNKTQTVTEMLADDNLL